MTDYQSQKIRNISFIAIIAVFFIHTLPQDSNRLSWVCFMQHLVLTVSNLSVTFFFIISGYLFFMSKDSIKNVSIGIKKKNQDIRDSLYTLVLAVSAANLDCIFF